MPFAIEFLLVAPISVRDIRKVTPIRDERPPVYFVETNIRVEASQASPPPASTSVCSPVLES